MTHAGEPGAKRLRLRRWSPTYLLVFVVCGRLPYNDSAAVLAVARRLLVAGVCFLPAYVLVPSWWPLHTAFVLGLTAWGSRHLRTSAGREGWGARHNLAHAEQVAAPGESLEDVARFTSFLSAIDRLPARDARRLYVFMAEHPHPTPELPEAPAEIQVLFDRVYDWMDQRPVERAWYDR